MKKILFFLLFIIASTCYSNEDYITAYTPTDWINIISIIDNDIWLGTQGGLVKYDIVADTFRVYHRFNTKMLYQECGRVVKDNDDAYWTCCSGLLYKFKNDEWSLYDGYNFAPLAVGNPLSSIDLTSDNNGNIWLYKYPYIGRISGDTFDKSYYLPDFGLKNEVLYSMTFDMKNSLWLSTRSQNIPCEVLKISADTVEFRLSSTGWLQGRQLPTLAIDSSNNVWISTDSGVTKYDGKNFTDYNASNSIIKGKDHYSISAGKKYIWVKGDTTIYKFDLQNKVWSIVKFNGKSNNFRNLTAYKDKALLFNNNSGLYIAETTINFLKNFSQIPSYNLTNFVFDRAGRMLAVNNSELIVINPELTRSTINLRDFDINYNEKNKFCIDSSDCFWIVSEDKLIKLNPDYTQVHPVYTKDNTINAPLPDLELLKVIAIDNKSVWLLSSKLLYKYDGINWKTETLPMNKESVLIDMCIDKNKNLSVINQTGVFFKKNGSWQFSEADPVLFKPYKPYITRIISDNKGGCYVGSSITLFHFIDGIWENVSLNMLNRNSQLRDMCTDRFGKLWLTSAKGLISYDGLHTKTLFNSFINITSSTTDNMNNLWLASDDGLIKIRYDAQLPDNFIKTVKMNYLVYNPLNGKIDKEIDSPYIYEILPSNTELNKLGLVGYFKNETKDRYLNFKVRARAFDKNIFTEYYDIIKNVDSTSLAGIPEITIVNDAGNTIPFDNSHGLPPGLTARVVFPVLTQTESKNELSGDIAVNMLSMNYNLDTEMPFPLEDITDDSTNRTLSVIELTDNFSFKRAVSKLEMQKNYYSSKINPKMLINDGADITWIEYLSDFGTNHVKFVQNNDKSTTIEQEPYSLLLMNRIYGNNSNPEEHSQNKADGDKLLSQIIDLRQRFGTTLSIDYWRNEPIGDNQTNRGFSANQMTGPEKRVVSPNNLFNEINKPDKLIVEFISADKDNLSKLINPAENDWTTYQDRFGKSLRGIPALSLFGGGGYSTAFLESDKDSILNEVSGLKPDIYDIGFDNHPKSAQVELPDYMIKNGFVRFRVRVEAKNDAKPYSIPDDEDNFWIQDIKLLSPCECGDIGITEIFLDTPYAVFPKDHNVSIPVKIRVKNTTMMLSPDSKIKLVIKIDRDSSFDNINLTNGYNHTISVPFLFAFKEKLVDCPPLEINNKYFSDMKYYIKALAYVVEPGGDIYSENDTLLAEFKIRKGDALGYEYDNYGGNDVGDEVKINGRGLNLYAYSSPEYNEMYAAGYPGGNGSGSIAVKFELSEQDTVFGFNTSWAMSSCSADDIRFTIFSDAGGFPGAIITGSQLYKYRACDDSRQNDMFFQQYVKSLYKTPIILPKGTYWASVTQLGETGFELQASGSRAGMITSVYDSNSGYYGKSIFINKYLSAEYIDTSGNRIVENKSLFAYRNADGVSNWVNFAPNLGNPAFGYLNHSGTVITEFDSVKTYTRGTWVPMIQVNMDSKYYKPNDVKDEIASEFSISPNPTSDFIEISVGTRRAVSEQSDIKIFNIYGQSVLSVGAIHELPLRVDVSGLAPGMYFVRIGDRVSKFIKL